MISAILKWLRCRYWDFEDALTDLIDWQPRPVSPKPLPPAPPEEQHHYTTCNCVGVGFQRADAESVDALWQQQIFKQKASGRFFEIGY